MSKYTQQPHASTANLDSNRSDGRNVDPFTAPIVTFVCRFVLCMLSSYVFGIASLSLLVFGRGASRAVAIAFWLGAAGAILGAVVVFLALAVDLTARLISIVALVLSLFALAADLYKWGSRP